MVELNQSVIKCVLDMPGAEFPWPTSVDALARELDALTLEIHRPDCQLRSNPFAKYEFLVDATTESTILSGILNGLWLYNPSIDGDKSKSRKWGVLFIHYLYGRGQVVYLENARPKQPGDYIKHFDPHRGNAILLEKVLQKYYRGQDWAEILCAFIRVGLVAGNWRRKDREQRAPRKNELLSSLADFEKCNKIAPDDAAIPFTGLAIASYFKHREVYQDWYDRLCRAYQKSDYNDDEHLEFMKQDPDFDDDFTDFEEWWKEQSK